MALAKSSVRPLSPEGDFVPVTRGDSVHRVREGAQECVLLDLSGRAEGVLSRRSLKSVALERPAPMMTPVVSLGCACAALGDQRMLVSRNTSLSSCRL